MKCAKCGAELKVGCIYCSVCGQEAQIVSDYSLLEDDFLRDLLTEEEKKQQKQGEQGETPKKSKTSGKKKKKSKKKVWILVASLLAIIIAAGIVAFLLINQSHNNSFTYQMEKAEEYQKGKEYDQAEACLKRALELDNTSLEARSSLAELYLQQDRKDDAVSILQEIIAMDGENQEAYQHLINIYAELKDYETIEELSTQVKNEDILNLFSDYLVIPPVFETEEGTYHKEISIEMSCQPGCAIYYTTDGTDPKSGAEYEGAIPLEAGKTMKIRAVSCNELGIYSEEIRGTFKMELLTPDTPEVTPDGGTFREEQTITVEVPKGCKVYYTWDGTEPTVNSEQYTEPIPIPEGNNILSLVLVDEYGMYSDVLKCNYIYLP